MRKLKTADIFSFSRCVKNIGVKDMLKEIAMKANTVKDIEAQGFDILYSIFELACEKKAEKEIYKFLEGPFEISAKDIEEMELSEFFDHVKQLGDLNTLRSFFKQAVR